MFAVFVLSSNRAIVTGSGGTVLTTQDAGASWVVSRLPQTDWARKASFISGMEGWLLGNPSKILKTSDGGATWSQLPISLSLDPSVYDLNEIEFINCRTGYLLANPPAAWPRDKQAPHTGRIYRTDDGGIHWAELNIGVARKYNQVIFLDSLNGLLLSQPYFSNFDFDSTWLHRTQDGGKSWTTLSGRGYGRMQFVNERDGWAGNMRTTDGGATWFHQNVTYPIMESPVNRVCYADTLVGYAISDKKILKSSNAGITWVVQAETENGFLQDIHPYNADICYACGYGGTVFRTTDGGRTWIRFGEGVTDDLRDVEFTNRRNGWVAGGGGSILHTTNGGSRWERQSLPEECDSISFWGIDFTDDSTGWTVGGEYILKTVNGGTDWQVSLKADLEYNGGEGRFRDVVFVSAQKGFVVGEKGAFSAKGVLLETSDGGSHWEQIPLIDTGPLDQISFVDENNGWICGWDILLSTHDGGATWTGQALRGYLRYMQWSDRNHGWLTSLDEGDVYRTTDGGLSWAFVPFENRPNPFISCFSFLSDRLGIAASFLLDDVMSTTDGGVHWSIQERLPPLRLNAMTIVEDTLVWAVGTHGTILKFGGSYFRTSDTSKKADLMLHVFPNPLRKGTIVQFNLTYAQQVAITIYDIRGSRVASLPVFMAKEGLNEVQWNPGSLASGTYFIEVRCAESSKTGKCVFLR